MARAVLGWSRRRLASIAGVSPQTVRRFEDGAALKASTVEVIERALENAGIVLIGANDGGPGAKLNKGHLEK
jgi:ribosome-binding protein aMBF1 (putative translation factor)